MGTIRKIHLFLLIILFLLSGCNLNQGENTPEVNMTLMVPVQKNFQQ